MPDFIKHELIKPEIVESRLYQEVLAVRVLDKGNSLVVAPTALGKTIVAALVSAHRLKQFPNKKILIVSPTKPLAVQHQKSFQKVMNLEEKQIQLLTGSVQKAKRSGLWNEAKIISATPQAIENDLVQAQISFKEISLLVFDEAHRAIGDYAYVFLAQQYMKQADNPLILALTASPGGEEEKIKDVCKNLFIQNVEIKTEKDSDVSPYVNEIEMDWVKVDLPPSFLEIKQLLNTFVKEQLTFLRSTGVARSISPTFYRKKDLLILQSQIRKQIMSGQVKNPALWTAISRIAAILKVSHAQLLLETQGIEALEDYFSRLKGKSTKSGAPKALKFILAQDEIIKAMHLSNKLFEQKVAHPKIEKLREILQKQFAENPDSRVLVFNNYRDSAKFLQKYLNDFPRIKAKKFVGQAMKENDEGMSQKTQIKTLEEFKEGKYNTLVCTSLHPEELIVLRDDKRKRIKLMKIGDFVESFIESKKQQSSRKITGWSALSTNGKKISFHKISAVHRHKRENSILRVKLQSGFDTYITENHSLLSFNSKGLLVPSVPKNNLFVHIAGNAPNPELNEKIDVVGELLENAPKKELSHIYCTVMRLNQAKIRVFKTDLKFLNCLNKGTNTIKQIANQTKIDPSTSSDCAKRLAAQKYIVSVKSGRFIFCTLTFEGKKYLDALRLLLNNCKYWKGKYRLSLDAASKLKGDCSAFDIIVGVHYGKSFVPRFLELNDYLCDFMGLYVSEGHSRYKNKSGEVYLAGQNKEMQKRMADSILKGLYLKPRITWRGVHADAQIAHHLVKYVFSCGIGAYNKQVPDIIYTAPVKKKWRFLEAYCAGDGHISKEMVVLTTASRKLATGLLLLLRQLGVRKLSCYKQNNVYRVHIFETTPLAKIKEKQTTRAYYDNVPTAINSELVFNKKANFYFKKKSYFSARKLKIPTINEFYDYISEINQVKTQPEFVYDLSIENTEKFFGGLGLLCLHNSVAEEGLDIPAVDLVIFFEAVPSEIRSIQRRGRTGRLTKGKAIVLMARNTRDEAFYWASQGKEKKMHKTLAGIKKEMSTGNNIVAVRQTTLHKFNEEVKEKVLIYVDTREQASQSARELQKKDDVIIRVKQLDIGDFVLADQIGVERKTVSDFLQSMIDGRLFNQLISLAANYERPLIILEGEIQELYSLRNIHPNAIKGAMASIALNYRIPIIFTKDLNETVDWLYLIAKREQLGKDKEIRLRIGRKALTEKELQQFIIESLPSVGPTLAKNLLNHFGSVKKVFNASEKQLIKVEKIGEKKAKEISKIINAQFNENKKEEKQNNIEIKENIEEKQEDTGSEEIENNLEKEN